MTDQRLTDLFNRWLNRETSEEEQSELFKGLKDPELETVWQSLIESAWDRLPQTFFMTNEQADNIFHQIIPRKSSIFSLRRFAIAASILLSIGLTTYFFTRKQIESPSITKTIPVIKAPTTSHAMITLASGQKIIIDSVSGTLASQGGIRISKLSNGEITYAGTDKEISYNTLTNPRGSRVVTITLNDGSKVWLNAESSLRYPTAFNGKERKVEITGEAYFEVAHNAAMPFIVMKGDAEVKVLGTHFNVNAYDDEPSIKITLLEGSVLVRSAPNAEINRQHKENEIILKPGEQASIQQTKITVAKNVDLNNVVAWKNGLFDFGARTDLGQIMRQLARWYDIDVQFQGNIPPQQFGGEMPRSSDLNQVLEILKTSGVHFKLENKKIIVMP